ncbi:MAG TPA: hypothetical protein VG293_00365 [Solirubrobacteraceae bacterium]|jgi:hypothetical protein|nr:hypothetical protein [Solirubrobacteraceae bacterium]
MNASARETEQVREHRRRAEESRALAAERRARAHELRAAGNAEDEVEGVDSDAFLHAGIEEVLAEIAELRAAGFNDRALSCEALARAETAGDERDELLRQASAAVIRAAELEAQAIALRDELAADPRLHDALSEAALARARAREHRDLALAARAQIRSDGDAAAGALQSIRAERHDAWAELHERLALAHQHRAQGLSELAESSQREADRLRGLAQAADERLSIAERGGASDQAADAAA